MPKLLNPLPRLPFYRNDTVIGDAKQVSGSGKVLLSFTTKEDESIMLKVGISAVDADGARKIWKQKFPHGTLTKSNLTHAKPGIIFWQKWT